MKSKRPNPRAPRARPEPQARAIPRPERIAADLIRTLRSWRDPKGAEGLQRYFKEKIVALGIETAKLRDHVQAQGKELREVWGIAEAAECCDRLLREPEMEIRGAGLLILAAFRKDFSPELLPRAGGWLGTRLDNWALVDSFCGLVLSPLLEQDAAAEHTLRQWSREKGLWLRRAAVVTLVPFARRGRFLDLAYELVQEHFADPEDLMHKATGWLLREAGKTDAARLRRFLLQHGPAIPRTALRYSIERFSAAERARLLQQTRDARP